jgi:hypothetical protein
MQKRYRIVNADSLEKTRRVRLLMIEAELKDVDPKAVIRKVQPEERGLMMMFNMGPMMEQTIGENTCQIDITQQEYAILGSPGINEEIIVELKR